MLQLIDMLLWLLQQTLASQTSNDNFNSNNEYLWFSQWLIQQSLFLCCFISPFPFNFVLLIFTCFFHFSFSLLHFFSLYPLSSCFSLFPSSLPHVLSPFLFSFSVEMTHNTFFALMSNNCPSQSFEKLFSSSLDCSSWASQLTKYSLDGLLSLCQQMM